MTISYEEWKKNMEQGIVDIIDDRLYGKYMKKYEKEDSEKEIQENNINYSIIVLILGIVIITFLNVNKIQDIIINNIGI